MCHFLFPRHSVNHNNLEDSDEIAPNGIGVRNCHASEDIEIPAPFPCRNRLLNNLFSK